MAGRGNGNGNGSKAPRKKRKRPDPTIVASDAQVEAAAGALRPQLQKALQALLSHSTIKAAAESIGVSEPCMHVWLRENEPFKAALHAVTRNQTAHVLGRMRMLSALAVDTIEDGMRGKANKNQIAAARANLDYLMRHDNRERQMDVLQNLGVRMVLFYATIVEAHVSDPQIRAAIKQDFLKLGGPMPMPAVVEVGGAHVPA